MLNNSIWHSAGQDMMTSEVSLGLQTGVNSLHCYKALKKNE